MLARFHRRGNRHERRSFTAEHQSVLFDPIHTSNASKLWRFQSNNDLIRRRSTLVSAVMNIERLRVFLAVYECSSMTAAAARLGITQPAVSQSVGELEDEVGAELFVRGRKGIVPTRTAERFWDVARRAVRAFEAAEHEGKRLRQPARTSLRIGATFAPAITILPRAMATFAEQQTDVLPTLRVLEGESLASSLRVDGFDVAVIDFDPGRLDPRHFETQLLFHDPLVLAESSLRAERALKSARIAPRDLGLFPLILPPVGTMARARIHEALDRDGVDASALVAKLEIGSVAAIMSSVLAGVGVALVSQLATLDAERRGDVATATIDRVSLSAPITAIRSRDGAQSEVADAFWAYLKALTFLTVDQRRLVRPDEHGPPSSRKAPTSSKAG
jgi:DNA-binding transcriptional LysR family regulator